MVSIAASQPFTQPAIAPHRYRGNTWEFGYSNYSQPRDYPTRVAVANHVRDAKALDASVKVLVDGLRHHNESSLTDPDDPLWCGYGPAPNAAWLIGMDRKVALAQTWFEPKALEVAIEALLHPVLHSPRSGDDAMVLQRG